MTMTYRSAPIIDMPLEQVLEEFRALLAEENHNHYRMGQLYNYVVVNELATKAKYKNALDYFTQNIKEVSRSTLVTYGAVARNFSEPACRQYGVTRLNLLLTYAEITGFKVNGDEPGGIFIEVPDKDGVVSTRLFSACSVEDMRRALLRKRKPTTSAPIPQEEEARVQRYRKALATYFSDKTSVRLTARNHQGQVVLTFKDIPMAQVEQLAEALLAGLEPVSDAA